MEQLRSWYKQVQRQSDAENQANDDGQYRHFSIPGLSGCMDSANFKLPISYSLHALALPPLDYEVDGHPGWMALTWRTVPENQVRLVHPTQEVLKAILARFEGDILLIEDEGSNKEIAVMQFEEGEFGTKQVKAFKAMVQCVLSVGGLDVVTATGFAGAVEYEVVSVYFKKSSLPKTTRMEQTMTKFCALVYDFNRQEIEICDGDLDIQTCIAKSIASTANDSGKESSESLSSEPVKPRTPTALTATTSTGTFSTTNSEQTKAKASTCDAMSTSATSSNILLDQGLKDLPTMFNLDEVPPNMRAKLFQELIQRLFCKQWKLVTSFTVSRNKATGSTEAAEVIFLEKDARILPGLDKELFSAIEIDPKNHRFSMINFPKQIERAAIAETGLDKLNWEKSSQLVTDFILPTRPSKNEGKAALPCTTEYLGKLLRQVLLCLNSKNLNVFGTIYTGRLKPCILLKPSNLDFSETFGVELRNLNEIFVDDATAEELEAVRTALTSRWPYPLTRDTRVRGEDGQEESSPPNRWYFKVKRYPWVVSLGNKHIDRAVHGAVLKSGRRISFPIPKNSDAESAKSLIVHILKAISKLGWRLQISESLCDNSWTLIFTR